MDRERRVWHSTVIPPGAGPGSGAHVGVDVMGKNYVFEAPADARVGEKVWLRTVGTVLLMGTDPDAIARRAAALERGGTADDAAGRTGRARKKARTSESQAPPAGLGADGAATDSTRDGAPGDAAAPRASRPPAAGEAEPEGGDQAGGAADAGTRHRIKAKFGKRRGGGRKQSATVQGRAYEFDVPQGVNDGDDLWVMVVGERAIVATNEEEVQRLKSPGRGRNPGSGG